MTKKMWKWRTIVPIHTKENKNTIIIYITKKGGEC